jgi:flagellar biosynthesis/type III secretory pathway chaperone
VTDVRAGADALAAALTEEQELLGSLLDLAGREERAIVGGDVAELTRLTDQKEHLLELVATLETERMTALTAIAGASSVDIDALTLSAVAELVEPAEGAALTDAGMELRARALALKEANEHNAALLRSSREIVDRWIQYLRTVIVGSLTYTAEGSPNESGDNRVIDRSA